MKRGSKNKEGRFRLILEDLNGNKRTFEYDLTKALTTEFTDFMPTDGWPRSRAPADEPDQSFDASRMKGHLQYGPMAVCQRSAMRLSSCSGIMKCTAFDWMT